MKTAAAAKRQRTTPDASLGRVVGLFGVRGEVKIGASRIGDDSLRAGIAVRLRSQSGTDEVARIERLRRHKNLFIASLAGISSADDALRLVGADLVVERAEIELGEREYFDADLVGCRLLEGDRSVGVVRSVRHYPAQDVLELEGGALVPLVAAFVRGVDVAARTISVQLPPGLVEGEPETA